MFLESDLSTNKKMLLIHDSVIGPMVESRSYPLHHKYIFY